MSGKHIPFNKPYLSGHELDYIRDAVNSCKVSGNGKYTVACHKFFTERFGFKKCLLTTSCTDALEMAAILLDIQPGDEVIMPSFTFVSTANAFVLRGARIVFCDSLAEQPNLDVASIEKLITKKTRVIVPVHYAGVACDMDAVMALARKYNLFVVEDAAQGIDSYYTGSDGVRKVLGSMGHMSAFSFHETKNVISGEGGMLVVNDLTFAARAEIIWEKGTNRSSFFRGEVDKYGWVDVGSSFLPSDIIAAFLMAQLEELDDIQAKRMKIWEYYNRGLQFLESSGIAKLPFVPSYATNNAHIFYIITSKPEIRSAIINKLKENKIDSVFHYQSLHKSAFYSDKHGNRELPNSDFYTDNLLRLPLFYELTEDDQKRVVHAIREAVS